MLQKTSRAKAALNAKDPKVTPNVQFNIVNSSWIKTIYLFKTFNCTVALHVGFLKHLEATVKSISV